MQPLLLLSGNPKGRKRRGKRRSAAQRAATRKMLAANGNPKRRRRGKRRAVSHGRRRRGGGRGIFGSVSGAARGAVPMLKAGAIGGAGAVGVDIAMGYAQSVLPASMASRVNSDGSMNFGYYGAKAAIAIGIGMFGNRLPVVGPYAAKMAEGALTVMSYEILRTFVPATMTMGFFNPAPTAMPRQGMGKILSVGKIVSLPTGGAGTAVATRLNAINRARS